MTSECPVWLGSKVGTRIQSGDDVSMVTLTSNGACRDETYPCPALILAVL